jgi:Raf kinase inhibitor-like YbhB/YbcL family protein
MRRPARATAPSRAVALGVLLAACGAATKSTAITAAAPRAVLAVASADLGTSSIPRAFTCDGGGRQPTITWGPLGPSTAAVVVEMLDPDAPGGTFTHWLAYTTTRPAVVRFLGAPPHPQWIEGRNDFDVTGYGAPCPPAGSTHHYVVVVSALDHPIAPGAGFSRSELDAAIGTGAALDGGTLTVTYTR